jgi:hypothetical protein
MDLQTLFSDVTIRSCERTGPSTTSIETSGAFTAISEAVYFRSSTED